MENKSSECGIVINGFENIYCQMYIRLNTGVLLIRFNSKNKKPGLFILRHKHLHNELLRYSPQMQKSIVMFYA